MKILRKMKFSFWFGAIATLICIINFIGIDDKNILLFLASPLNWLTESYWFAKHVIHPARIPMYIYYFMLILSWFIVGGLMDLLIHYKNKVQS